MAIVDFYANSLDQKVRFFFFFIMIEEKVKLIIDVEYKIREIFYSKEVDKETTDKDSDVSEVYIDHLNILQQKLNELLIVKHEDLKSDITMINNNTLLNYLKIQLPTFNGEIENWLQFWGQLKKTIKILA